MVYVAMVFTWAGGCHLFHPHHLCQLQMLAPSVVVCVCGVCGVWSEDRSNSCCNIEGSV